MRNRPIGYAKYEFLFFCISARCMRTPWTGGKVAGWWCKQRGSISFVVWSWLQISINRNPSIHRSLYNPPPTHSSLADFSFCSSLSNDPNPNRCNIHSPPSIIYCTSSKWNKSQLALLSITAAARHAGTVWKCSPARRSPTRPSRAGRCPTISPAASSWVRGRRRAAAACGRRGAGRRL